MNKNKINTRNNPKFLELGTKYNDQIVLMKQLENMEEKTKAMNNIIKAFLLTQGSVIILLLIALIINGFNN